MHGIYTQKDRLMEAELFLIRHGETEWNLAQRFQGQLDSPLTATGIAQAKAAGKALREYSFDAFFSSDLGRALKTANYINDYIKFPKIEIDLRLRERNFGILHGTTRREAEEKYPEIIEKLWNGEADFTVPEGESRMEFINRAADFFNFVAANFISKRVLVVSHGGFLNMAIRNILDLDLNAPRRFLLPNTGINIFQFKHGAWFIKSLGIVTHLKSGQIYDETV